MTNPHNNPGRMRRRFIIFILSIALISVLTHCEKKCEPFDYDIVQWLPYEESDRIPVSNSIQWDTLELVSREITHSDGYPIFSCCACINSYSIKLASAILAIEAFYFDSRSYVGSSLYINHEDLVFNAHYDTYEINGTVYNDVLVYINDREDSSGNFSKILLAKGIGIVTISGADGDWIITDLSVREIDPKKIHKITEDC